jgi:hypothetical protein
MRRRLRWEVPKDQPRSSFPKHPYRDTAFVYGGMALVIVIAAFATGGDLSNAIFVAVALFIVATLWSWRNWRNRLRAEERRKP